MNDARQAASEKSKSPMAIRPPGWVEVRDMLIVTGWIGSNAQIIQGSSTAT
jgi:hypothetical protein